MKIICLGDARRRHRMLMLAKEILRNDEKLRDCPTRTLQ
jgi:hypothetical protein